MSPSTERAVFETTCPHNGEEEVLPLGRESKRECVPSKEPVGKKERRRRRKRPGSGCSGLEEEEGGGV
jgi:hypothetical protein